MLVQMLIVLPLLLGLLKYAHSDIQHFHMKDSLLADCFQKSHKHLKQSREHTTQLTGKGFSIVCGAKKVTYENAIQFYLVVDKL